MMNGLVFGKFMPLHKGHLALIDFARKNCDHLFVVVCFTKNEPIAGQIRVDWLEQIVGNNRDISIIPFPYDELFLPNTSVSSKDVSKKWANTFIKSFPQVNVVFTSEPYGEYMAEYMNIKHILFDQLRKIVPISAFEIRSKPFKYWEYIPEAIRYWFVKKVCIAGSESTGKSTLTEQLALYFKTSFVPEMARDVIEKTEDVVYEDLLKIANLHAKAINAQRLCADKLLFVDTDLLITKSYSKFLFAKDLIVEPWIEEANKHDLYLFLEPDCEYVQDGTRLNIEERNRLSDYHKRFFLANGINIKLISGDWNSRFTTACKIVSENFNSLW